MDTIKSVLKVYGYLDWTGRFVQEKIKKTMEKRSKLEPKCYRNRGLYMCRVYVLGKKYQRY